MRLFFEFDSRNPLPYNISEQKDLSKLAGDLSKEINQPVLGKIDTRTSLAYIGYDTTKLMHTKEEIYKYASILENYIKLLLYDRSPIIQEMFENNQRFKDTISFINELNYRPFCYTPLFMNSINILRTTDMKEFRLYLSYQIADYLRKRNIPYYSIQVKKFKGSYNQNDESRVMDIYVTKHNIEKYNLKLRDCIWEIIRDEFS